MKNYQNIVIYGFKGLKMDQKLQDWRKEGKHLPYFLKDFHDQKDFFKFLHEFCDTQNHEMVKDISWVEGHVYSIDILLWCLARFGYTLQKNKTKVEFDDLDEMIKEFNLRRTDNFAKIISEQIEKNKKQES